MSYEITEKFTMRKIIVDHVNPEVAKTIAIKHWYGVSENAIFLETTAQFSSKKIGTKR